MPQSWDMGQILSLPLRKIQRLRPGSNPRTPVPEASMLTTRPQKRLVALRYLEKVAYSVGVVYSVFSLPVLQNVRIFM